MKVLHLLASPYFSGPAESLTQLALAQRSLGHDVSIAVDRKRTQTSAEELAVPRLQDLGLLADVGLELSVKSSPLAVARDIKALKSIAADVIHCHFSHDHLLARWGRQKGTTLVRSIHAPRSVRRLMPVADAWTVPFEALKRPFMGPRVMVLPPLVSASFSPPASRAELRRRLELPDVPLVGMVSTFQPSRRHALGVAAFDALVKRRPEAHLVLIGDGELVGPVQALVKEKGLSARVHFVGYQRGEAFVRWLQALDEVWVLGLGNDFSARAAAQARAVGVRVIGVNEGALSRFADVVVPAEATAVAKAALSPDRRHVTLERPEELAARVLELYGPSGRSS
ncbi:MAG: glycosyltransferase [Myxococcales bacterium]|nr:glycosyltransferase [Myxococcales bacterium]